MGREDGFLRTAEELKRRENFFEISLRKENFFESRQDDGAKKTLQR